MEPATDCRSESSRSSGTAGPRDSGSAIGTRTVLSWGRMAPVDRAWRAAFAGAGRDGNPANAGAHWFTGYSLPAASASSPAPESAQPRSSLSPGASARSLKRTRRPSRHPFTNPTRSSACRWRVVHDCDNPTASASSPTHRSATARALTNRKREATPRQARTGRAWVSCRSDPFIAQRCISHLAIDRNDLALIVFAQPGCNRAPPCPLSRLHPFRSLPSPASTA